MVLSLGTVNKYDGRREAGVLLRLPDVQMLRRQEGICWRDVFNLARHLQYKTNNEMRMVNAMRQMITIILILSQGM